MKSRLRIPLSFSSCASVIPNLEAMSARDSPVCTTYTPEGEEIMPRRGPAFVPPAVPAALPTLLRILLPGAALAPLALTDAPEPLAVPPLRTPMPEVADFPALRALLPGVL